MIVAGLDLGQSVDHAALVVGAAGSNPLAVKIGMIHQYPVKTSYAAVIPDVVKRLSAIGEPAILAVDARGPGKPVIDMLAVWPSLRLGKLMAVSNTSSERAKQEAPRQGDPAHLVRWTVPKAMLLGSIVRLLKLDRLSVGQIPEADLLKRQFEAFGYKFSKAGNLKLEARTGHDDLILALALCIWAALMSEK
ncbi:MAG TPA: hypothetical protein VI756_14180 [Blastocatellia bacterium]